MDDEYPTTARAHKDFTATCGHEVRAGFDYIVQRPGRFYCSPACGASDRSKEITILLQDEGSLSELLYGVWGSLFWLVDNEDGTYGLFGGGAAGDALGEAYMRVMLEKAYESNDDKASEERLPAAARATPSPEVAEAMRQIRIALGWDSPEVIVACDRGKR